MVDFLLVLIERFSPILTGEALWANIGQNFGVRKGSGPLRAEISGGRVVVHQRLLA